MKNKPEHIDIPYAPDIEGLAFRKLKVVADYPDMADVANRSWETDLVDFQITVQDLVRNFEHPLNFDPHEDVLIAEVEGKLIAYSDLNWIEKLGNLRLYKHHVVILPNWRGRGIRRAMLRWNEQRLREIANGHPKDVEKQFEVWAASEENDWKSLLENESYKPSWFLLEMVFRDLDNIPDIPFPEGIEVRPVKPEHYRKIWKASQEALRDDRSYTPDAFAEEGYKRLLKSPMFMPELWQVAWDGDEIVGAIHNYIDEHENRALNRKWGHPERVFVRRQWRRRGIAKALLAKSLKVIRDREMEAAALDVDTDNPSGAPKLYKSLGFRVEKQFTFYWKPL